MSGDSSEASHIFVGPYHGTADAFHYFKDDLLVITDAAGNFISGWGSALNKKAGIEAVTPPNANKYIRAR